MLQISDLPLVNACLNGTCSLLLLTGFALIRAGRRKAHRNCMVAAFLVSTVFLVSYLTYHFNTGTTRYTGTGWARSAYFTILLSHTFLAALVPPMAIWTLWRGLSGQYERHRRLARWTLPIWLYVSVTGVVIYLMLYPLGGSSH